MAGNDTGVVKRGRGRPPGSKNKPKTGRPKGRKSGYTVSSTALLQRRRIAGSLPAETEEERSYNARLIDHVMRINEISTHADRSDIETLKSCFIAYMQLCQEDGFPVGNIAAYASMGFRNIQQFDYYAKSDDPDARALATFVRSTCAMARESKTSDGKINPVIGIFWQRNYDGLRNDTEQIQSLNEQDETEVGGSYKQKYKNLIGD